MVVDRNEEGEEASAAHGRKHIHRFAADKMGA